MSPETASGDFEERTVRARLEAIEAHLPCYREVTELAGELIEFVPDEVAIRAAALQAAIAVLRPQPSDDIQAVFHAARAYEAYLREDTPVVSLGEQ